MTFERNQRLLILGAGSHQLALIRRAESAGVEVVVADYLPDSPGKALASYVTSVSAIDTASCIEVARRYEVDGVLTAGTDMPIVTMADVAAELSLPCYLSPASARLATDKVAMIDAINKAGGNRPRSVVVRDIRDDVPTQLALPVVVKPADSQGQRGVVSVAESSDLRSAIKSAMKFSRAGEVIVEEFVDGPELTVNAWVDNGRVRILAINDRVTYNPPPSIGIAYRHVFPSAHNPVVLQQAEEQARIVAQALELRSGPMYIQMIVSANGVFVVEAAARVGGGHESEMLPIVSGYDVIGNLLDAALPDSHLATALVDAKVSAAVVTFLFANDGVVRTVDPGDNVTCDACTSGFYVNDGDSVHFPRNGTDRVGYVLCTGASRAVALARSDECASSLRLGGIDSAQLLHTPPMEHILSV